MYTVAMQTPFIPGTRMPSLFVPRGSRTSTRLSIHMCAQGSCDRWLGLHLSLLAPVNVSSPYASQVSSLANGFNDIVSSASPVVCYGADWRASTSCWSKVSVSIRLAQSQGAISGLRSSQAGRRSVEASAENASSYSTKSSSGADNCRADRRRFSRFLGTWARSTF